jgi:hypothetical protein
MFTMCKLVVTVEQEPANVELTYKLLSLWRSFSVIGARIELGLCCPWLVGAHLATEDNLFVLRGETMKWQKF